MASQELKRRLRNALRETKYSNELLGIVGGTTGSVFYVDSVAGAAANTGQASDEALATIDQAINKCTANKGDRIVVMPGHAESVIAASGITCDVAGVEIIGLGSGSSRPQVTLATATTATIVMSAADVTWENVGFIATIDALVVAFPVTAAGCGFFDCGFTSSGTTNVVTWFTLDAASYQFTMIDCVHRGSDTAGDTSFLTGAAADGVVIKGLVSNGDFSAANIDMSAAWTDCLIESCRLQNSNAVDVCIEGFSAATGWLVGNMVFIATNAQVTGINTVGTLALFNNYQVNLGGETGLLIGVVSV